MADFVGEPKINLVTGTVDRRGSDVRVRVGPSGTVPTTATSAALGRPVVVGLRPQDARVVA